MFTQFRQYLKREQPSIDLSIQLLFSKQLADAVAYLTKQSFVHRDIAARNCLVSTPKCVKLSDFGMCRLLDDEVYNCKHKKPKFKRTNTFSNKPKIASKMDADWVAEIQEIYSRDRCIYVGRLCLGDSNVWRETVRVLWATPNLTFFVSSWQNTRNHEVVTKLERGELLPRPENCPTAVYEMLREMWHLDPKQRTEIFDVYEFLKDFLLQLDHNVIFEDLTLNRKPVSWKLKSNFHSCLEKAVND